jgi:hypothetical protein
MRSARLVSAVLSLALLCPGTAAAQPVGGSPAGATPAANEPAAGAATPTEPAPIAGEQPGPAPEGTPDKTPEGTPDATPDKAPDATPDKAPDATPGPATAPGSVTAATAPAPALAIDAGEPGAEARDSLRGRVISASILGGVFATFSTWAYFAWYRPRAKYDSIVFLDEGWFGPDTYAGGADKLGHLYANYAFVRGGVAVLEAGGWDRWPALAISGGLTVAFFTGIEVKDGYHLGYGFSYQDITVNLTGNAIAILLMGFPALDRAFDLRIEYFPTRQFIDDLVNNGGVDAAEDYTGQAFMIAHHLGSIGPLRRTRYLGWTRYVDVVVGYQARNYKPEPDDPVANPREQELYLGLTLDMQALIGAWRRTVPRGSSWGPVLGGVRGAFEYYQLPYTTLDVIDFERNNGPLPPDTAAQGLRW